MSRRGLVPLVAVTFVLGALPHFLAAPIPDVSWLLYTAREMLGGARLYIDLVEVNPPLIVWLNLVPAALAARLGLSDIVVYRALVVAAALVSFVVASRALGLLRTPADPAARRLLCLMTAVALVPLAGGDFGEREHLLLILGLPYVLLVAVRASGVPVGAVLSLPAGIMAGVGIALKPYFLLLPLALEGWLLLRRRTAIARPETLAMAAVAAAYLAAIQLWATPFWELARDFGGAYYRFLQEPLLLTAFTGHGAALALCAMLAYVVLRDRREDRPLWTVLLLATIALYGSAVLQRKGWRYHFYPSMATGLLLLTLMATAAMPQARSLAARLYRAVATAVVVFVPLSLIAGAILQLVRPERAPVIGDPDLPALADLVRREIPGGSLLVLSTNMASAFPLVPLTDTRWASRFPSVWLLGALYHDELGAPQPIRYRPAERQPPLERYLLRSVAEDLSRHRPDLLVVLRPAPDRPEWGIRRLDYLEYFSADPLIARELAAYGFLADVGEYRIYRRGAPGTPPAPESGSPPPSAEPAALALGPGMQVAPPGLGAAIQAMLFLALVTVAFRRQSVAAPPR